MATMMTTITMIRRYSELCRLQTFEERFDYLKLKGVVGESTFGFDRYLNQLLYRSSEWKRVRNAVIVRDDGCDMGLADYPANRIIVHHMNPLSVEDLNNRSDLIFNPEFLICVSFNTHNAIHFGDETLLPKPPVERKPGDTCPWR
jgi:hypothetical protein